MDKLELHINQKLRKVQEGMSMELTDKGQRGKYRGIESIMSALRKLLKKYDLILVRNTIIEPVIYGESARIFICHEAYLVDDDGNSSIRFTGMTEIGTAASMGADQASGAATTYADRRVIGNLCAIGLDEDDPDQKVNIDELKAQINACTVYNELKSVKNSFTKMGLQEGQLEVVTKCYENRYNKLKREAQKEKQNPKKKPKSAPKPEMDESLC